MIRQIEDFRAKLDMLGFGYVESLTRRKVELRKTRSDHGIPCEIANDSNLVA